LAEKNQKARLEKLLDSVRIIESVSKGTEIPPGIDLPKKDIPILQAAIQAGATHLITGDFRDFGRYYGRTVEGVTILPPAAYLKLV